MWVLLLFLLYFADAVSVSRKQDIKDEVRKFTVQMTGYSPDKNDDYVAVSRESVAGYIVGFEPLANADRVHHMLLYGCQEPAGDEFWKGGQTCGNGPSHILYAWARNAPNLVLPNNVAFSVGHENDGIKYFVLQVHYAQPFAGSVKDYSGVTLHMVDKPPKYYAAVMLFVSGAPIPPGLNQFQNNISCEYTSDTAIHPFAFRTHTHAMGRVVSSYYKHDGKWNKVGSRNPQWPQLFESIPTSPVITKGDMMGASCRFDSHDKKDVVPMGSMGSNEMCNFYMMFYWEAAALNPYPWGAVCAGTVANTMNDYPKEGFDLLPSHPELEHHAHQSATPFGILEEGAFTKIGDLQLGQVAGLSFDTEGNLIIFHRAGRLWDQSTFDQYNVMMDKNPIKDDVILIVKFTDNKPEIVKKLGKNKFYLPHGIHMDKEGFIYTTDVGSHTVAKWKINGDELEQVWQDGQLLIPDSDRKHYCKPAGIVRTGESIFVADGYCNSRVVELGLDGKRKNEFGLPGSEAGQFLLPHDVVVNSQHNLLVTDRENGRVQEITQKGEFVQQWKSSMFSNVYSADVWEDAIYMVPGRPDRKDISVYVGRAGTGLIEFGFQPTSRSFGQPHSIRICPTGDHIFIGDIQAGQATLWKFKIQKEKDSSHAMASSMMSGFSTSSFSSSTLIVLALISLVIAIVLYKKLTKKTTNGNFDRKGFKPLRTEEAMGFISDGSESD